MQADSMQGNDSKNDYTQSSYVVISPCRDEDEYMVKTLDSMVAQTHRPKKWIIVDDGSTDSSPEILRDYAARYPFIEIVTRANRGYRKVGPGVVDAFYEGYNRINADDYDFVCKLDLDLDIPARYFETLIKKMAENPRIGTCSGKPYNLINGKLVSEERGDEMSVGMIKFYRVSAFKQIGGIMRQVMWDAIDCHRCRQLGWIAISWDEPDLRFIHLRLMGSSQQSILVGRMRHGFGQYFMGTGVAYMAATSVYRMLHRPFIIGGLAMFWGYLKCVIQRPTRIEDAGLQKFIRGFQWRCLLLGKTRAMQQVDKLQEKVWNPERPALVMPALAFNAITNTAVLNTSRGNVTGIAS